MAITYYTTHKAELQKEITKYKNKFDEQSLDLDGSDIGLFQKIRTAVFNYELRYYQMEALYILDYLMKTDNSKKEKKELLEKLSPENPVSVPFMGFEMATGSGKTALMGATIYYLNEKYNIKNFLIITPKSLDIYSKTIRNFSMGGKDSIWAPDTLAKFNLITGDDYNHLYFDESKPFNVFIFNIDKFGPNAKNTSKTWESSYFRDGAGNTVSVKEYLNTKDLVIITDEAHHAQSNSGSGRIIKGFSPKAVLEFTATALEDPKSDEKRSQKVVYKYDIKSFLEDGYGKLVRAVALDNQHIKKKKKSKEEIPDSERWKLITLFLFHFLKKEAILQCPKSSHIKPIALIKVKDHSDYAKRIYTYITEEIFADRENFELVLGKIKEEEIDIIPLLKKILEEKYEYSAEKICKEIENYSSKTLLYSGDLDKERKLAFEKIQTNLYEIIVYIYRLDEGIDLPNIYTIAVINDNDSDFKTSVKQIIGRGVRLPKDKREYDDHTDEIKSQSEQLHIICDRGKNFETIIREIKQELNLNDKLFSYNSEKQKVTNKVKRELLKNITVPKLQASDKIQTGVTLNSLMSETDKIIESFIQHNCSRDKEDPKRVFLKFVPTPFFTIVDLFNEEGKFIQELESKNVMFDTFSNIKDESDELYKRALKLIPQIPDSDKYKVYFHNYTEGLNQEELKYFYVDEVDHTLAKRRLLDSFSYFFNSYIHKHYYKPDYKNLNNEDVFYLESEFQDKEISLTEDRIGNAQKKTLDKIKNDADRIVELIQDGFYFFGYKHSIYDYNKFDSLLEKQMADYLDRVVEEYGELGKDFWVKNDREIYFGYGNQKYYPDFLFHHSDMMNVIETKGEYYTNTKKNQLLEKLNEIDKMRGLLIYSKLMDDIVEEFKSFEHLIGESKQSLLYEEFNKSLLENVEESDKYKRYLPYYTLKAAAGAFSESQEATYGGWLPVPEKEKEYPKSYFLVQVKGHSMHPRIKDGDICIFDNSFTGSKNDQIVLVQHKDIDDPENGGKYTVKVYESKKQKVDNMLLENIQITLRPINKNYQPIVLNKILSENDVMFIGVFKDVLELKET